MKIINMIEFQFNTHLKVLRSDDELELILADFFNRKLIFHQTSCVKTP